MRARTSHSRLSIGGSPRVKKSNTIRPPNADILNEEEFLFLWKGLVENGQLSLPKLQMFMSEVAGTSMSVVQTRDLLDYMDANGDGCVGREDFKNFLAIGHLSDTDSRAFMWEPKKKFQEENPFSKHAAVHDPAWDAAHGYGHGQPDQHSASSPVRGCESKQSHNSHDSADDHNRRTSTAKDQEIHPPHDSKAPGKRRPHGNVSAARGSVQRADSQALDHLTAQTSTGSRSSVAKPDENLHRELAGSLKAPKNKPPPMTKEVEKKIEQALLKYEQQSWEKFLAEEINFKRQLFEQFAGQGNDTMGVSEYHKMLHKWISMASWCAPRGLRPADSLASLEYVLRREQEEPRHDVHSQSESLEGIPIGAIPEAVGIAETAESAQPPTEAKMSFALWLDVLNGKHQPEEHHVCPQTQQAHQAEGSTSAT